MAENELEAGKEIEEKIVEELSRRHLQFIGESQGIDFTSNCQMYFWINSSEISRFLGSIRCDYFASS